MVELMKKSMFRLGTVSVALLAGAATAGTATAANSSPKSPNAATRKHFCTTPGLWHKGAEFSGVSNSNTDIMWRITSVVDSPQQTQFYAIAFITKIGDPADWSC
jgi:hypothetical protein